MLTLNGLEHKKTLHFLVYYLNVYEAHQCFILMKGVIDQTRELMRKE